MQNSFCGFDRMGPKVCCSKITRNQMNHHKSTRRSVEKKKITPDTIGN